MDPGLSERSGKSSASLPGINVSGYFRTESGVGAAVRGYVRALRHLGAPLALEDLSDLNINRAEDRTLTRFDADHPYEVNLVCADVEQHFALLSHLGEEYFDDRYNIAIWAWELPRFPKKWYDRFAYYDEIWVGTSFVANALAPVAPIPVVRIPPVLTMVTAGSREEGRRRLGVSPGEFVFLFIFDFHSHFARKNPLAAIEAFRAAFTPSDPVRLVIKCVNGSSDPSDLKAMRAAALGHPIFIHDGYWPAEEVRDLIAACDAYVSLHRSEGTGLTISDAMALGKPVIATDWSGNMDFMNVTNSFLVRYALVELTENVGPYQAREIWAEPSVEHAAELMRLVFEKPQEAGLRGQAAKQQIETNYSEKQVANLIRERLEAIAMRRRWPAFQQEIKAHFRRYCQLPERICEVVRDALPPDATVLVVSKGDNALLQLDGRRAWHFPQREDGVYASYYPADSAAAIVHLEALRKKGAEFLLLPQTAFWWLEHYQEFRQHLEDRYRSVLSGSDACKIFALAGP
jgi:glycosyltransferase involved in cell wall biosynthesis